MGNCMTGNKNNYKNKHETMSIDKYKVIEWKDTVPFVVPIKSGKVIKVYDGDTITVAAHLPYSGSPLYRFSVRLNGIDTPEIKGKNENEKKVAIMARDALSERLMQKNVELRGVKTEKYGRILATVYLNNENMNQWMIDNKFAVEYDGGTKQSPDDWLKYHKKLTINTNCSL